MERRSGFSTTPTEAGWVISGELPDAQDERTEVPLSSPDTLAVNALGQLAENPRVVALRNFIMGWHVSYLSAEDARGQPEAGPEERLSKTGDNLANVIQYLSEEHPERLEVIFGRLRERVPKDSERYRGPDAGRQAVAANQGRPRFRSPSWPASRRTARSRCSLT